MLLPGIIANPKRQLVAAGGGAESVTYVGGVTADEGANTTSLTPTMPAHQSGDLGIAYASHHSDHLSMSLTVATGWTELRRYLSDFGSDQGTHIWYKIFDSGTETDPVFTIDGSEEHSVSINIFRGVDPTTPMDVYDAAVKIENAGLDPTHIPPVTTLTDNAAVMTLAAFTLDEVTAVVAPSGMTTGTTIIGADKDDRQQITAYNLDVGTAGLYDPGVWSNTETFGGFEGIYQTIALRPKNGVPTTTVDPNYYTITVDATIAGSSGVDHFAIPSATYTGYYFDWVEVGDASHNSGGFVEATTVDFDINFGTSTGTGSYTIRFRGNDIRTIRFNNSGDILKLTRIESFGNINWNDVTEAYFGCSNLTGWTSSHPPYLREMTPSHLDNMFSGCAALVDTPGFANWRYADVPGSIKNCGSVFKGCALLNHADVADMDMSDVDTCIMILRDCDVFNQDISGWNMAKITNMSEAFRDAAAFNQPIGDWPISSLLVSLSGTLRDAIAFDQDLSSWNVTNVTTAANFLNGVTLSTANYDALLNGWGAQAVQSSVPFHGGNSQYSAAAAIARDHLINVHGWTITDGGPTQDATLFKFTVDASIDLSGTTGTAANYFRIPSNLDSNYNITWEEDGYPSHNGSETANAVNYEINFGAAQNAGVYHVTIDPVTDSSDFDVFWFNNAGDDLKMISIEQWGTTAWDNMNTAYYGCDNMTGVTAPDTPDLSVVYQDRLSQTFYALSSSTTLTTISNLNSWDTSTLNSIYQMFRNQAGLVAVVTDWDVGLVTSFSGFAFGATLFDPQIGGWNVSSAATNISYMLNSSGWTSEDLSGWNVTNVTTGTNFMVGVSMTTAHYDATLIAWEAQAVQSDVSMHFGNSTYTPGGAAQDARARLINTYGWVITDDGPVGSVTAIKIDPLVTGVAYDGQTLSCTTGTWDNPSGGYTYQWQADGVNISGETSSTYVMERAYEGDLITCDVTNNSVTATSNTVHLWIPTDSTATMESWIDYSVTGSITEVSGAISDITDQSGNANDVTQGTEAAKLQTGGTINGKGSAVTARNDYMSFDSGFTATVSTFVMVYEQTGTLEFAMFGEGSPDDDYVARGLSGSSDTPSKLGGVAHASANATMLFDGESTESITDRGDVYTTGKASNLMICVRDGDMNNGMEMMRGYGSDNATMVGDFAEAIIYSTGMSAADIARMQGYAAHKWAFTGSITGHTYETDPPAIPFIKGIGYTGGVLEVEVAGDSYQWKQNGTNISGATFQTYVVAETYHGDAFTCEVTTGGVTETSNTLHHWTPADISTSEVGQWHDTAFPTSVVNSGGDVSQWDDQSTNNRDLAQTTGGNQPSYANDLITFDGTDDYLFHSDAYMYDNGDIDVYVVAAIPINEDDNRFISEGSSSSSSPIYAIAQAGVSGAADDMASYIARDDAGLVVGAGNALSTGDVLNDTLRLLNWRDTGSVLSGRADGGTETTYNYTRSGTLTLNRFSLGCLLRTSAGSYIAADVGMLVVLTTLATTATREKLEAYAHYMHGTALPGGHTYENDPPTV